MIQKTAKIFWNGRSQAVRLPKEFRFAEKEVFIRREGNQVILTPKPQSWRAFFEDVERPTADYMAERTDDLPQEREILE